VHPAHLNNTPPNKLFFLSRQKLIQKKNGPIQPDDPGVTQSSTRETICSGIEPSKEHKNVFHTRILKVWVRRAKSV
jgi:hypothetical protein